MAFITKNVNLFLIMIVIIMVVALTGLTTYYHSTYQNLSQSYDQKLSDINKLLGDLNRERSRLNETSYELTIKEERESELSGHYVDVKQQLDTKQTELDTTKASLATTQTQLATAQTSLASSQLQVTTLTATVGELKSQVNELTREVSKLQSDSNDKDALCSNVCTAIVPSPWPPSTCSSACP